MRTKSDAEQVTNMTIMSMHEDWNTECEHELGNRLIDAYEGRWSSVFILIFLEI